MFFIWLLGEFDGCLVIQHQRLARCRKPLNEKIVNDDENKIKTNTTRSTHTPSINPTSFLLDTLTHDCHDDHCFYIIFEQC